MMSIMKSVDSAIHLNWLEEMQHKLNTVIPVLNRFMTLTLEDSYAPIVTMIDLISGRIYIPVRMGLREFAAF